MQNRLLPKITNLSHLYPYLSLPRTKTATGRTLKSIWESRVRDTTPVDVGLYRRDGRQCMTRVSQARIGPQARKQRWRYHMFLHITRKSSFCGTNPCVMLLVVFNCFAVLFWSNIYLDKPGNTLSYFCNVLEHLELD